MNFCKLHLFFIILALISTKPVCSGTQKTEVTSIGTLEIHPVWDLSWNFVIWVSVSGRWWHMRRSLNGAGGRFWENVVENVILHPPSLWLEKKEILEFPLQSVGYLGWVYLSIEEDSILRLQCYCLKKDVGLEVYFELLCKYGYIKIEDYYRQKQ